MIIPTEPVPVEPLNGDVQLALSKEGHFEEVDLDYETVFREGDRTIFKCYDRAGDILYVRMRTRIIEESVFGDLTIAQEAK